MSILAYLSLYLSLFYLMSCPLIAILNVKNLDNLYALYPMVQAFAYVLYLLKDFDKYYRENQEESEEEIRSIKLDNILNIFNVIFSALLLTIAYMTRNIVILSFVLYPLGLKIAIVDNLIMKGTHCKIESIGENREEIGE
ncbi:hypothetical protein [Aminipila terrae]|uniref:Uncharacterized protein n=1 Tax=Aminipila terrae TaxID=2697030 RepID=A0A6P1MGZ1_9FIRM|nr:hypothetical protein [Aminipila terrae]QHI71844.1 hypothetical protein Ami3637_05090 [Aminipila terrae]